MNLGQHILIFAVRLYRWTLSPLKGAVFGPLGRCRYTPSCSEFAIDALREHGIFAGVWLALKRIGRCHPWGGCGFDPIPPRKQAPSRRACDCFAGHSAVTARAGLASEHH